MAKSLASEQDVQEAIDMAEGGGGRFPFLKLEKGDNFILILSKDFASGHKHFIRSGSKITGSIPSVNQKDGFSPKDDPIDQWCLDAYNKAKELASDGKKTKAKELKEQANNARSQFEARFVAMPGKVILVGDDEKEKIVFKTKKFTAAPSILALTKTRFDNLIKEKVKEWIESDEGVAKKFNKASDLTSFVICAFKDDDGKIQWSLHSKVDPEKLPKIDKKVVEEMIEDNDAQYDSEKVKDSEYKKVVKGLNGESADDDDDEDDDDEDDKKKKKSKSKSKGGDDDEDIEDDEEDSEEDEDEDEEDDEEDSEEDEEEEDDDDEESEEDDEDDEEEDDDDDEDEEEEEDDDEEEEEEEEEKPKKKGRAAKAEKHKKPVKKEKPAKKAKKTSSSKVKAKAKGKKRKSRF